MPSPTQRATRVAPFTKPCPLYFSMKLRVALFTRYSATCDAYPRSTATPPSDSLMDAVTALTADGRPAALSIMDVRNVFLRLLISSPDSLSRPLRTAARSFQ